MSIKAMNWAWEQPLPPVPKLVLMALADNADDHGYCWPKMKTIAAKCSTSERTVQRTIKTLLAAGLLKKDARFSASGQQVSNGYTLALTYPDKLSPSPKCNEGEGDTCVTPGVTQLCQGEGDKAMSPLEPPYEPSYESSVRRTAKLMRLSASESQQVAQLISSIPADQQQAITNQLLTALDKGAIHTSPSRWLKAVIRRTGRNMQPQRAPELSEEGYVERLIEGGISPEDAQRIAQKTFSRRAIRTSEHTRLRPLTLQTGQGRS